MPEKPISRIIGDRLRNLRKERGLSQEKLAHLSSLHPTYIGQIERGEKNATIDTIEKVTKGLEITLEELFRFSDSTEELQDNRIKRLQTVLHRISEDDQETLLKIIEVMLEWKNRTKPK
jgi:transcriptional regulator with XRE-family HTH domain